MCRVDRHSRLEDRKTRLVMIRGLLRSSYSHFSRRLQFLTLLSARPLLFLDEPLLLLSTYHLPVTGKRFTSATTKSSTPGAKFAACFSSPVRTEEEYDQWAAKYFLHPSILTSVPIWAERFRQSHQKNGMLIPRL